MAEQKKQRTIVAASDSSKAAPKKSSGTKSSGTKEPEKKYQQAKPVGNAGGLRCGAVICWVLALVCELLGFLLYFGKISITFAPTLAVVIAVIVVDLIFVVIGSQLWKKANHIDPASKKNKVKFFLWNNLGVIMSIVAFLPYIILILLDKEQNFDKNTRIIAVIAAVIALAIGSLTGVDWNPVSQEELNEATTTIADITDTVYWTPYGHVYHTSDECSHLNNSDKLIYGTVEEAVAANRVRLCKTCAARDNISIEAVED